MRQSFVAERLAGLREVGIDNLVNWSRTLRATSSDQASRAIYLALSGIEERRPYKSKERTKCLEIER